MDPNRIIQALKGTIDPKLRLAAENELNQVGPPPGPAGGHFQAQPPPPQTLAGEEAQIVPLRRTRLFLSPPPLAAPPLRLSTLWAHERRFPPSWRKVRFICLKNL